MNNLSLNFKFLSLDAFCIELNRFVKSVFLVLFILLVMPFSVIGQSISSHELIKKSINYHDPEGRLFKKEVSMDFTETRPNGADRKSSVGFDMCKETFELVSKRDEVSIVSKIEKGVVSFSVDGNDDITTEMTEKYKLNPKRTLMMKNYYQYLWLMPMKLNDPGTMIDPEVEVVDFFGKESLAIRVTYSEDVGKDIWYFYFHPETYAMQGYRFYHDEVKNDGEYILLEEETVYNNVRLPKRRTWYTHKEDKLLGTDILDELSF